MTPLGLLLGLLALLVTVHRPADQRPLLLAVVAMASVWVASAIGRILFEAMNDMAELERARHKAWEELGGGAPPALWSHGFSLLLHSSHVVNCWAWALALALIADLLLCLALGVPTYGAPG